MNAIPWEDKPKDLIDPVWRYSQNPIIQRDAIPSSNSIFNSAVVPYKEGFAGVFRCDNKAVQMNIFAGFSKNGIDWKREGKIAIDFKNENECGIVRACVLKDNDIYKMWYSYRNLQNYRTDRHNSYRIGYAESFNGIDATIK